MEWTGESHEQGGQLIAITGNGKEGDGAVGVRGCEGLYKKEIGYLIDNGVFGLLSYE